MIDTPVLWSTRQCSFQLALNFLPSDVTEIAYELKYVSSVYSWSQDTCGLRNIEGSD